MALSDAELAHLLTLARLELDDAEVEAIEDDLNQILGYVERLAELDLDDVEPLARPLPHGPALRDDVRAESMDRDRALALGRGVDDGFFRVPRTVDED